MENKDLEPAKTPGASRREYRFRAWDPINKRMYKAPCIIFEPNGTFEAYDDAREWEDGICRNSILMQWTGLQDKHGRDIYEGDLIRGATNKFFPVTFEGGRFRAVLGQVEVALEAWPYREVVGNIYEAPSEGEALPNPSAGEGTTDVTPSTVQGVEAQATGGLVVGSFRCSDHGPQTPVPACPLCLEPAPDPEASAGPQTPEGESHA